MSRIFCLNNISKRGLEKLTEDYQITDSLEGADGVLVRSANMHEMELPDGLLAIARAGAGVNNIPIDKCTDKGIVVFNTPGANANGVKELVIAGMLLAARDIYGGITWVNDNQDDANISKDMEKSKKMFAGTEIKGKRLGVIGLGAIGVQVANVAADLGMKVYGCDPYLSVNGAWQLSHFVKLVNSQDKIFEKCDYITIHVPLMDSTRAMINAETIAKMKDGVVVLNYARDLLVDDDAMLAALESGKVAHYLTDFPTPKLAGKKGVIATPHLGASTEESEDNCAAMAVSELMEYIEYGSIRNSVNLPACELSPCRGAARICIFNENKPNMIGQFTKILADKGINISDMTNKSKGSIAYTVIDADEPVPECAVELLLGIDGVNRVRVLEGR